MRVVMKASINTRSLSDSELLKNTKNLVGEEQKIITKIVVHLEEIERRKLYSDLKYTSLFEYCTKELKYSEDQACRRIGAMRASKEVPKIKDHLDSGALNLTAVTMANRLINDAKKESIKLDNAKKEEIFNRCTNQTKSEVQNTLFDIRKELNLSDTPPNKPVITKVSKTQTRIHLTIENELMEKLEKLKGLLAHKNSKDNNYNDLVELLNHSLDVAIKEEEKRKFALNSKAKPEQKQETKQENKVENETASATDAATEKTSTPKKSTTLNSKSSDKLEMDYVTLIGHGKTNNLTNARVHYAGSSKRRAAIKPFGQEKKMDQYLFKY